MERYVSWNTLKTNLENKSIWRNNNPEITIHPVNPIICVLNIVEEAGMEIKDEENLKITDTSQHNSSTKEFHFQKMILNQVVATFVSQ